MSSTWWTATLVVTAILSAAAAAFTTSQYLDYEKQKKKEKPVSTPSDESLILEQLARHYSFLGEEGCESLRNSLVVVVGCGGVGSHAAHMLARAGVGHLRVIDFDQVTLSSLNRHAVATLKDVGISKVRCLQMHVAEIVPWCRVDARAELFKAESAESLILPREVMKPCFVLDCIDNVETKADLLSFCHKNNIPVLSAMGAGAKADPSRIQLADISETYEDPLARATRRLLRKKGIQSGIPVVYSTEKPGQVHLMPLPSEAMAAAKQPASAFAPLPDFRVRVLPVLGTLPAMFGCAMATFVICKIAKFPLDPLPMSQRDAVYRRAHMELNNREGNRLSHGISFSLPVSAQDCGHVLDEIWRGRSALSGSRHVRLGLARWRRNQPGVMFNLVALTPDEIQKHETRALFESESLESLYGAEVVERIEKRLAHERIIYEHYS